MMFLVSDGKGTFECYGSSFYLEPISYPSVNLANILVTEDTLGNRLLSNHEHFLEAKFEAEKIPGFPSRMTSVESVSMGAKVVVLRGGGIGDLILLLPALRMLRNRLPKNVKVTLATFCDRFALFEGMDEIDEIITLPARMTNIVGMNYYIEFSERLDLFGSLHMTDYYLTILGIDPEKVKPFLKQPDISKRVTKSEKISEWYRELRRHWKKVIYVNIGATDIIRRLPPSLISKVATALPDVAFVVPSEVHVENRRKPSNVFALETGYSLRAYISAIYYSDGVLSSDSSAYHLAAALNKPAVALFGPICSKLRSRYYPTVISLDADYRGQICSSPCGLNAVTELEQIPGIQKYDISKGCPEANIKKTKYSPCLLSIPLDKIVYALSEILS
ncbi:MAG TPA: hypothetical protein ENG51_02780 [Deltaproteobacteria bacterium]|nr:hypothetical protein [Deltaproteobacteria bacterium]